MANQNRKVRSQSYTMLSDSQKEVLTGYFEKGMTGTGRSCHDLIARAAEETGLTKSRVEKWIGNERSKRRQSTTEDEQAKRIKLPPMQRGPNPYNLFCAEFFQTERCRGLDLEAKNRQAATEWKSLPNEEKSKFEEIAQRYKKPNVTDLSADEKKRLIILRHRRQLFAEIMLLEDLGCQSAMMLLDTSGEIYTLGSSDGVSFLSENHDVVAKFRQHFYTESKKYTYHNIQKLFNKKYSDAIGKPGSRVPYLKGNFAVEGLPCGVLFKRPFYYGAKQCKAIMQAQDAIRFVMHETQTSGQGENSRNQEADVDMQTSGQGENSTSQEADASLEVPVDNMVRETLKKVATKVDTEDVVAGRKVITKEDIEVDLSQLSQDERFLLYTDCNVFLDKDAWSAIGSSLQDISGPKRDLILPVYTEAEDEDFWLFYCPEQFINVISTARASTRLKGYWLDRIESQSSPPTYTILTPSSEEQQSEIKVKWIIKNEHGPLYYIQSLNPCNQNATFEIPALFQKFIRTTLSRSGFIS